MTFRVGFSTGPFRAAQGQAAGGEVGWWVSSHEHWALVNTSWLLLYRMINPRGPACELCPVGSVQGSLTPAAVEQGSPH